MNNKNCNSREKSTTVVIPAKNEAATIGILIEQLKACLPNAEIIVVNDGSTDDSERIINSYGVMQITHPYSKGNGAAIKAGIRAAQTEYVVCMDADGQHKPEDLSRLLAKFDDGYDMVVGYRTKHGQAGLHRSLANGFYNSFSSWMVGQKIKDLTSGFRAFKRELALEFISLLPNKFSYPTTLTISFFRAGYSVAYIPVTVRRRSSETSSHINLFKDGLRFFLIIFKVGTLYSPLKLFMPISAFFGLSGVGYYLFTFFTEGRFTNMSALLLSTSILIFLMGLVSEQITAIYYKD